jgi:acyl-CoA thioester hydrolase
MTAKPVPDTRDCYAYFQAIETRWMDNDAYGHVNNTIYFSWFDTVISRYMLAQGVLDRDAGPVCLVVETACNYFKPIAFPDAVCCGLRLAHIGTSSARFETGIFRDHDADTAARGHFVQVCCDRKTQRPVPMPQDMRTALEKLRR